MLKHINSYLKKDTYKLYGIKLIHFFVTIGFFYISFLFFRYGKIFGIDQYNFRYNYYATALYAILVVFFNRTYHCYLLGYTRVRVLVVGQFLSQSMSSFIVYIIVSLAWNHFDNPMAFIFVLVVHLFVDIGWSVWANIFFFNKLNGKLKTLLVYRNNNDKKRFGNIKGKTTERMYNITKEIQYDGSFSELQKELEGYDAIFVAGVNSDCRNGILKYCKLNDISGFFLPHIGDTIMQAAKHVQTFDSPVLFIKKKELSPEYAIIKRLFDIISSGIALGVLSPLIFVIALIIHFYDNGPVFYRQTRLTRDGKHFDIIKFRSMMVDAEKDGVARLSTGENDDRITPVGKILRRFRLDEIPQLWNIFIGDMSVVGPRPERPEIAEQYYKNMPDFRLRLQVKAGLTGYAQVYGKYNTAPYEKLEFDLLYINNMNILVDLQLCFATVMTLFKKESTEGVDGIIADINEEGND